MFFFPTNIVGAHMLTQSVNYLRGILNKCKKTKLRCPRDNIVIPRPIRNKEL